MPLSYVAFSFFFSFLYISFAVFFCVYYRRDVDAAVLSAGVKGRLRAKGDKLLKQVAAGAKAAAAAAAQSGVRALELKSFFEIDIY